MPRSFLVVYDAECGLCARFKRIVQFLDAKKSFDFASLDEAEALGRLDAVDRGRRYRSFHLVSSDNMVLSGSDAILPLAGLLASLGAGSKGLESVPGLQRAVSFGYSVLSRAHGTSCNLGALSS